MNDKTTDAGGRIGSFYSDNDYMYKTVWINDRGYPVAFIMPKTPKRLIMLSSLQIALQRARTAFSDTELMKTQVKHIEAKIEAVRSPLTLVQIETGTEERTEYYFNDTTVCIWAFFWKGAKLHSISFQKYPDMTVHSWKRLKKHESVKLADIYTAIFEGIL